MSRQEAGGNLYRYPSVQSMQSMASIGYLPPGHGYVPRKQKPDKPYGPSFVSRMNRTWRGEGKRNLCYALACAWVAILFFVGAGVYWGHRNTSRMIVLRTEVWGAVMTVIGILFTGLTFHFIWVARKKSNDWRYNVRFRAEGMFMAAAYNHAYVPEDGMKLATGTYGARAVKEIPKPGRRPGRSRGGSMSSVQKMAMANAQLQDKPPATGQPQPEVQGEIQQPFTRYAKKGQEPGAKHGSREYLGPDPAPRYAEIEKSRPPPSPSYPQGQPYGQGGGQRPPTAYPQGQDYPPPTSPMAREAAAGFAPLPTQPQQSGYSMAPVTSQTPSRGYAMPIQGVSHHSESEM